MGIYIILILLGLALFVPIISYNNRRKRSNTAYYILFIVQLIAWFLAAILLLKPSSTSSPSAMEHVMGSDYVIAYSVSFQIGITIIVLTVLAIKSAVISKKK